VAVPPAVVAEVTPELADLSSHSWLVDIQPRSRTTVEALRKTRPALHAGEAEAIALALEIGCPLIIDERLGSRAAAEQGVPKTGVLGILVAAHREGLLPEIRAVLDELMRVGFRASPRLIDQILRIADEA
jgi:hypothetical protein